MTRINFVEDQLGAFTGPRSGTDPDDNVKAALSVTTGAVNPNSAFGKVYWVDKTTGSDSNDGLSPATAFASIAQATTVNNADVGTNTYNINTIYVNTASYAETLTAFPANANVISIGAGTFLTGAQTSQAKLYNCHFYGFWFVGNTAAPIVTVSDNSQFVGFHNCTFAAGATTTYGIQLNKVYEATIEGCKFLGNPLCPTAIYVTAIQLRTRITNNWIAATTNGILINNYTGDYGNLIDNNFITRQSADPNSSEQMAYGIKMLKPTGTDKWLIARNSIEAVDAIYSATADTAFQNQCISNATVQVGTGVMEDPLT